MECVSVDQVVKGGGVFRRRGRYWPLSVLHLLLIALVLRLRVSPWSLMHMRNNVFACSHALCMAWEEATVLWWTLCPRSCVFFFCAHLCICLCVNWFAISHTVKSTLRFAEGACIVSPVKPLVFSSFIFLAHNAALVTCVLVPLASTVADWSGQSTAPHWPIHLYDWSITDSVCPVVCVFLKSCSWWSLLSVAELIYSVCVFSFSSTIAI